MNAAAYLDADASALADREHTNTHTNTNRPRPLTEIHLDEMEYTVRMLRWADKRVSDELKHLGHLDLGIDLQDVQQACNTLVRTAVLLHLRVQLERAGRPV